MARGDKGPERPDVLGSTGSAQTRTGVEPTTASDDGASEDTHSRGSASGLLGRRGSTRGSGRDVWQMRNWRLRTKLLTVLLIPSIAALGLGLVQVAADYRQYQRLVSTREQIQLDASAAQLVHELQRERDLTVAYIASGRTGMRDQLVRQRRVVNRAIQQFSSDVSRARQSGYDEVADRYGEAASRLDRIEALRSVTDETSYPAEAALRAYTDTVQNLVGLAEYGVTQAGNPEVFRLYLATNALARAKEQQSIKRARLAAALQSGEFDFGAQRALLAANAEQEAALSDFRKLATTAQVQFYNDTVAGLTVDKARTIVETALVRAQKDESLAGLSSQEWMTASTETVNLIYQVGKELRGQLQNKVADLAAAARTQMYLTGALVLGALLLAFAIALMVARSLLLPLRTLRRSALDVADNRLPEAVGSILEEENPDLDTSSRIEPIPVHTTEEIGRVARSFDAVNSQALRLASEQALLRNNVNELFVNLARRSQTLVQRQLSLIERLEQDEQDPDQLGQLFELDHLATRMRRNNENLLILGGTDLTKRMMRPVPLAEVLGAAVSEVEQYARVVIADTPDLAVQGRVVNDIVHLIAELLENATEFSNPETEVTVRTAYRRQTLVLEIRDRGVGIDDVQLADINDRLMRPPDVDVAISRRMGLYVVGQLARRHHIGVELQNNGDLEGGSTATVRVSGELMVQLTPNGPMPMPDMPRNPDSQRDPLTETGSHAGLAAAFGGQTAERSRPEPATEGERLPEGLRLTTAGGENGSAASGRNGTPVAGGVPFGTGQPAGQAETAEAYRPDDDGTEEDDEPVPGYSVQYSSGGSYGAGDVPHWDVTDGAEAEDGASAGTSAPHEAERASSVGDLRMNRSLERNAVDPEGAEQPDTPDHDGRCGLPPGVDAPGDLFHSPFEAEKTTQFERPPLADSAWEDPPDDADAAAPVGGFAQDPQPGGTESEGGVADMDDAPTERLPIYEAVLSQWFRESDEDEPQRTRTPLTGSDYGSDTDLLAGRDDRASLSTAASGTNGYASHGTAAGAFGGRARARREVQERDAGAAEADRAAEVDRAPDAGAADPVRERTVEAAQEFEAPGEAGGEAAEAAVDTSSARGLDSGWGAGDDGWRAAEQLAEQSSQVQEVTGAGLPKRTPQSNLVPGSARQPQSPAPSKPAVPRSPDAVRGRMSNFQQGVRRGRHAKVEPDSTEQFRSMQSRPEEQE